MLDEGRMGNRAQCGEMSEIEPLGHTRLQLVERIMQLPFSIPILAITESEDVETETELQRLGCYSIEQPIGERKIDIAIAKVLEHEGNAAAEQTHHLLCISNKGGRYRGKEGAEAETDETKEICREGRKEL